MRGAWLATLAAAAFVLCACGGSSADDPADAACPDPPVSFGKAVAVGDHREVSVGFTCEGARLRGTIYLPPGPGRHPAVIWLHGSGEQPRLSYGPLVAAYVRDGIAFFTYSVKTARRQLPLSTVEKRHELRRTPARSPLVVVRGRPAQDHARVVRRAAADNPRNCDRSSSSSRSQQCDSRASQRPSRMSAGQRPSQYGP
jgi:hypothetical protein